MNKEYYGYDYKNAELVLFTQSELYIDKFKPSASALRVPIARYTDYNDEKEEWYEGMFTFDIEQLLTFIKKYKYIASLYSSYSEYPVFNHISSFKAFTTYYMDLIREKKRGRKIKNKNNRVSRYCYRKLKKLPHVKATMSDWYNFSPSLHLSYYVDENACTKEELEKINYIINIIDDKYWNDMSTREVVTEASWKDLMKLQKEDRKERKILWEI